MAGFRLAQTCHACATEFAHQKADFAQKRLDELTPTVTRDPPRGAEEIHLDWGTIGHHPYGTERNPIILHVKWEDSGFALRRLYAISQQPGYVELVNELWRQTWPKTLLSDLLCDGMPEAFPVPSISSWDGQSPLFIDIRIQITSNEPLQLPWNWLAGTLQYALAAGLRYYLNANLPQLLGEFADIGQPWGPPRRFHQERDCLCITTPLFRPARADQLQCIMSSNLEGCNDTWLGVEEVDDRCRTYTYEYPVDAIHVKPKHMQKVAVTGDWCGMLPDANKPLWLAHHGIDVGGQTVGDDVAANLWDMVDSFEQCDPFHDETSRMDIAPSSMNNEFKPFTCEFAGQSDWHLKQQQVKQQGKFKRVKAARRKCKAGLSRSSQAKLTQHDLSDY